MTLDLNLPDIDGRAFMQELHCANGVEFTASFSCGVTEYRAGTHADGLYEQADQFLYKAKQDGRNRVRGA
ncbi:PleD family two-component response regulator [Oxalobacteraceae bacterium GrIS 1.11]